MKVIKLPRLISTMKHVELIQKNVVIKYKKREYRPDSIKSVDTTLQY